MFILNEGDVAFALERAAAPTTNEKHNLLKGAAILARLVEWTNDNSDGWPYWQKPARAAEKLQRLVSDRTPGLIGFDKLVREDITYTELQVALRPVRAFLTRQADATDTKRRILGEVV